MTATLDMNMADPGIETMSKAEKASVNETEAGAGAGNDIPKDTKEEAENVPALHLHIDCPKVSNLFLNRIISRRAMSLGFG